jgi:hypothetical protein
MSADINVKDFLLSHGLDPRMGLGAPVTGAQLTSLRAFIRAKTPAYEPTIRGCFRQDDYWHMMYGDPNHPGPYPKFNLFAYNDVRQHAPDILDRVRRPENDSQRMPPPPDNPWSQSLIDLFWQWVAGGMPP